VNLAHREDIVAAIVLALEYRGAPRVLNVSDGAPAQASEVARWCATARGETPDALEFTCDDPPTRSNQKVSNAALRSLGWRPRFASFREGGGGL
jgi:nucleoside-diphosphate-sugar epimerase